MIYFFLYCKVETSVLVDRENRTQLKTVTKRDVSSNWKSKIHNKISHFDFFNEQCFKYSAYINFI